MPTILVVDDEPKIREALCRLLQHEGHVVHAAESGGAAIRAFEQGGIDLTLLDIALPDMNGLDVFNRLREKDASALCVFITAYGTVRSAVEAMRSGAFDYVTKPFDNQDLLANVERALQVRRLAKQVDELQMDLKSRSAFTGILGDSAGIRTALRTLAKAAPTDATVLLTGESGTGKELAARSLHRQSRRVAGPFVPVNCAAVPTTLAEAEFFGTERGAFTDAKESRPGYFEQAHGGTLFLDEVGELPLELQAKLLRVLQEREVTRLGGRRTTPVDVRVIAATNRELQKQVTAGRFREDLFWRLNVFPIHLPPLRERLEDLPSLTAHFIDRLNVELGTQATGVSENVLLLFGAHPWPGNVRELENAVRYAMIMAEGATLKPEQFPSLQEPASQAEAVGAVTSLADLVARSTERVERTAIQATLKRHRGNRTATAIALGIGRRTLFTKMRLLGLVEAEAVDDADA